MTAATITAPDTSTDPQQHERLYTPLEVAERLRIQRRTVYELIRAGLIGVYRVTPRNIRVPESELQRFLNTGAEFHKTAAPR